MAMALAAVAAIMLALLAGCGSQTGDANDLLHQSSDLISSVKDKVQQVDTLLDQASQQSNLRQLDTEKQTLSQANDLLNQAIPQIEEAKAKVDQAARLNISSDFRKYLQARSRALDAARSLRQTQQQKVMLMMSDPGFDQPDTARKFADLQNTENSLNAKVQQAESQADQIAHAHPDEIR